MTDPILGTGQRCNDGATHFIRFAAEGELGHAVEAMYGRLRELGATSQLIVVDWLGTARIKMQSWRSGVVKKLTSGVGTLLKGHGTAVIKGRARITGPGAVEVTRADGETVALTAKAIVVATGSRPVAIPGFAFDGEHVLDSTGGLHLADVPKRVVVIGGGYIGLELGGAYARLGSKVTVVEMLDQLLTGFDLDFIRPVERALKKAGAAILLKTKAMGWKKTDDGLACDVRGPDGTVTSIDCDKILVTVGRRPNLEDLGLVERDVAMDDVRAALRAQMPERLGRLPAQNEVAG